MLLWLLALLLLLLLFDGFWLLKTNGAPKTSMKFFDEDLGFDDEDEELWLAAPCDKECVDDILLLTLLLLLLLLFVLLLAVKLVGVVDCSLLISLDGMSEEDDFCFFAGGEWLLSFFSFVTDINCAPDLMSNFSKSLAGLMNLIFSVLLGSFGLLESK